MAEKKEDKTAQADFAMPEITFSTFRYLQILQRDS